MHAKSIRYRYWMTTNWKSQMVPFHWKLCDKLITKPPCLYLYVSMRPRRVPISLFSKINLSKAFSTLHCMHAKFIWKWMTTNKTNHSMLHCHQKLRGKVIFSSCAFTCICWWGWQEYLLPSSQKSQQMLFNFCTACMPSLYASKWQQTKQMKESCLAVKYFVANSSLNSRAFICICLWDWQKFLFHSSQKKTQQILFHSALHVCQAYLQ